MNDYLDRITEDMISEWTTGDSRTQRKPRRRTEGAAGRSHRRATHRLERHVNRRVLARDPAVRSRI